jgi:hypothetical protein
MYCLRQGLVGEDIDTVDLFGYGTICAISVPGVLMHGLAGLLGFAAVRRRV